jgi:hypothetical protein
MMDDRLIVELLLHCEAALRLELRLIRGNLSSKQWLSGIWELILLDAALALGSVKYEHRTPGGNFPDLQLDSHSGTRLTIEAAFLRTEKSDRPRKVEDHPVFRVLKEKGRAAKRSALEDPYVVFLGTDRVFDIASSRHSGGVAVEEAVSKAFRTSLSAVVLVPIFARSETFKPLQKQPRPLLYENPSARVPLTKKDIDAINRFDFERWQFDRFTRQDAKRPALREALARNSYPASETASSLFPQDDGNLPFPCWTYIWRFNRLRIVRVGTKYSLFNNRELQDVSGKTAEQVARAAAEMYQMLAQVMGSNGPERHPDPGVPADLSKWILELPDKSL